MVKKKRYTLTNKRTKFAEAPPRDHQSKEIGGNNASNSASTPNERQPAAGVLHFG